MLRVQQGAGTESNRRPIPDEGEVQNWIEDVEQQITESPDNGSEIVPKNAPEETAEETAEEKAQHTADQAAMGQSSPQPQTGRSSNSWMTARESPERWEEERPRLRTRRHPLDQLVPAMQSAWRELRLFSPNGGGEGRGHLRQQAGREIQPTRSSVCSPHYATNQNDGATTESSDIIPIPLNPFARNGLVRQVLSRSRNRFLRRNNKKT